MDSEERTGEAHARGAGGGRRLAAAACIVAAILFALALAVVALGGWFGWKTARRHVISSDLLEIHREIRESDLEPQAKDDLLRRIEDLRASLRRRPVGMLEWRDFEEALRGITRDRRIPPEEQAFLERELERLERSRGGSGPPGRPSGD